MVIIKNINVVKHLEEEYLILFHVIPVPNIG